jgi:uncharacterized protein with HEPN domain
MQSQNERDLGNLLDIHLFARDVRSWTQGIDLERLRADDIKQAAVLHRLILIGEAARRLSLGFQNLHPVIPWTRIAGLRNHLVHEYGDVNLEIVWRVVAVDIPALIDALEPLIPPRDSPDIP